MCSVPDDTKKAYTLRGGRMSTKMCKWKDLYLFLPTMFFAGRVSSPRLPRHTTIRIEMWKIQKLFSVILDGCLFTASRKKWYAELMWMVQNLIYFYCILRDGHNFRNSENMHSIEDCNDLDYTIEYTEPEVFNCKAPNYWRINQHLTSHPMWSWCCGLWSLADWVNKPCNRKRDVIICRRTQHRLLIQFGWQSS